MDVGCNRRISKPSSVKEKYCLHLFTTKIEDKQLPWHLILTFNSSMKPTTTLPFLTSTHHKTFLKIASIKKEEGDPNVIY
jgi:hypothetical protein